MLIKKIDRYILGEILGPFLGGAAFFLFIFLMFQALRLAEFFIVHGIPGRILAKMTLLMSISFLPTVLPVAFLIAVLMAFRRFSSDSELAAMKASGMSVSRLSVPVVACAILVTVISLRLNMQWVPWGEQSFKRLLIKVSNTKVVSSIKEGAFTSGFFDLLIFADKVDTKTNHLERVFIFDEREPQNPLTVVARNGEILSIKSSSELGAQAMLRLHNGSIHHDDLENDVYQKINFGEYRLYLKVDEGDSGILIKPHMIPYTELMTRIHNTDPKSFDGREMRGEYWRRVAMALAPLIFAYLGIGFGAVRGRTVRAGAAMVAFFTLLVYWSIQTVATVQILRGNLNPFLAMQLPNLVVFAAAIYGYRRAAW